MVTLTGLPGVRKRQIEAVWFKTPNSAVRSLAKHRAVTDAGDAGSVTVYRDDRGKFRCYLSRYRSIATEATLETKAAVLRWLTDVHPKIRG